MTPTTPADASPAAGETMTEKELFERSTWSNSYSLETRIEFQKRARAMRDIREGNISSDVIAWRWRERFPYDLDIDKSVEATGRWNYGASRPLWAGVDTASEAQPLVLKSALDASRAETDAAKRERDAFVIRGNDAVGHLAEAKGRIVVLSDLLDAANARAEALERERGVLRKVLKPFAACAEQMDQPHPWARNDRVTFVNPADDDSDIRLEAWPVPDDTLVIQAWRYQDPRPISELMGVQMRQLRAAAAALTEIEGTSL